MRTFLFCIKWTRRQELSNIFGIVCFLVGFKYRGPRERLPAQRAPEGPFARMHSAVVLHVVPELEGLPAELALEGPITGVDRQMCNQRTHIRKTLPAKFAQHHSGAVPQVHVHGGRLVGGIRRRHSATEEGRRRELLAVLKRLQGVREDVAGELALMGERSAAVHARVQPGRTLLAIHQLLQPNKSDINFLMSGRRWRDVEAGHKKLTLICLADGGWMEGCCEVEDATRTISSKGIQMIVNFLTAD